MPAFFNPVMFVSYLSFACRCVDQLLNIFYATMFCYWMPQELQIVVLVDVLVLSVIHFGEIPYLQAVMRDFKSSYGERAPGNFIGDDYLIT